MTLEKCQYRNLLQNVNRVIHIDISRGRGGRLCLMHDSLDWRNNGGPILDFRRFPIPSDRTDALLLAKRDRVSATMGRILRALQLHAGWVD